jgi:hypothetical protein
MTSPANPLVATHLSFRVVVLDLADPTSAVARANGDGGAHARAAVSPLGIPSFTRRLRRNRSGR